MTYKLVDGWMDRWMETDRQADRQTDRQTDRQIDRQMDRQIDSSIQPTRVGLARAHPQYILKQILFHEESNSG